jgi:Flp pilus assembly protein TadG
MNRFRRTIRAFLKDESGVLLAEALILMPLLIWGFLALVVYWDLFRTINVTQKAAYGIADALSRQTIITTAFVDDIDELMAFLTPGAPASEMRITSFQMNEGATVAVGFDSNDSYCLLFSRVIRARTSSTLTPHTPTTLKALTSRIPDLDNLESSILVETWVDYVPDFDTGVLNFAPGVQGQTFTQFIVTRPRNDRRVVLDGQAHTCP